MDDREKAERCPILSCEIQGCCQYPEKCPMGPSRIVNHCRAQRDGDCCWSECPQLRDGEPHATGRHCPLDVGCQRCGLPDDECEC